MEMPTSDCVHTVKHPDGPLTFNVSFMRDSTGALMGVKPFALGNKRPRRGKHMMPTASVRNWVEELEIVKSYSPFSDPPEHHQSFA